MDEKSLSDLVPPAKQGIAEIVHFEVSEADSEFTKIRAVATRDRNAYVPPGKYVKLCVDGAIVMSNTPMEVRSNRQVVRFATGDVLIAGLGIGMILNPILGKENVHSVTVIEKSQDVIDLVGKSYMTNHPQSSKLRVINANIFDWKPMKGLRFDTIYFDIWTNICVDNLEEIRKLNRRFCHYKSPGGWMSSWQVDTLRTMMCELRIVSDALARRWASKEIVNED
jgi:hypothetical protein